MKPSEIEFVKKAQALGYLDTKKLECLLKKEQEKNFSLYSLLLKENLMTIEQVAFIQKELSQKKQSNILEKEIQKTKTWVSLHSLDQTKTLLQQTTDSTAPQAEQFPEEKGKKQFGRYTILSQLGEGGMGVVYKAYDPALDRVVALKVITSSRQQSKISIERFQIEARATASLKNPYIINIYDIGEEKDLYYFTMDFIDGDTLENFIKNKQISKQNALKLMAKICRGIDYAHSQNIIHRDLKPANIMIDKNGDPRIMDFGLAKMGKMDKRVSQTGALLGTPVYMSPEQAAGKNLDFRTDVYSLGAIFYKILTGIEPFHGDKLVKILEQVIHKEPPSPTKIKMNIHKDLEIICQKAMSKDPDRRYETAGALADDIERFLEGDPIQARPASFFYKSYRKFHKNKILAICIFVLCLIAISLYFSESTRQKQRKIRLQNLQSSLKKSEEILKNFHAKSISNIQNLEEDSLFSYQKAVRELAYGSDLLHNSEFKNQFIPLIQEIQNKSQALLAILIKDASFYYDKRYCKKSQNRYQTIKSLLYLYSGDFYSKIQQNIDKKLEQLYDFQIKSQDLNERAKAIFHQEGASLPYRKAAIQILQESLNNNKENPETFYFLGRLYYQGMDYANAIKNFRECHSLQNQHFASMYYLVKIEAKEYLVSKEKQSLLKEYIKKYKESIEKEDIYTGEQKSYFYLMESWLFMFEKKRVLAQEKCRQAIKSNELLAESYYLYANFLTYFIKDQEEIQIGSMSNLESIATYYSMEEAMKALELAMTLEKYNPLGYMIQGKIAFDFFCFSEAVEKFDFVIHHHPCEYAYLWRGLSYLGLRDKEKALADFEKICTEYKVKNSWLEVLVYSLYLSLGQKEKAVSFIQRWKEENSLESIRKYFGNPFDETFQERFALLESLPMLLLSKAADYPIENEIKKFYINYNNQKNPEMINIKRLFPDTFKLSSYLNAVDDFQIIEDGYHIIIKNFLNEHKIEGLGAAPVSLYYFFFMKEISECIRQNHSLQKFLNSIAEKTMGISIDILVGILDRFIISRSRSLLLQQKGIHNSDFYYQRAMLWYTMQKYEESLEDLRVAEHLNPKAPSTHYAIAKVTACLYKKNIENKQRQSSYLDSSLYHLEQALVYGWKDWESPLKDYNFSSILENIKPLLQKYRSSLSQEQWTKLWESQKKKKYGDALAIASLLPKKFLYFRECLETEQQYHYNSLLNQLNSDREILYYGKEGELSEPLQEKLKEKLQKIDKRKKKKILVDMQGKGDFISLQEAIEFSSPGTTILLSPGVYEGNFILKSGITICPDKEDIGDEKGYVLKGGIVITSVNIASTKVYGLKISGTIVIHNSDIQFQKNLFLKEDKGQLSRCFDITGSSHVHLLENKITKYIVCKDSSHLKAQKNQFVFVPFIVPETTGFAFLSLRDESSASIEECTITQGWGGVALSDLSQADLYKNSIFGNASYAVSLTHKARAKIVENEIYNQKTAIKIADQSFAQMQNNKIHKNHYGILYTSESQYHTENDQICHNLKKDIENLQDAKEKD
ncbi:MAG: protein kinase [Candidatus Brocadiae bacterium]|nr:protein kinase [Candidatus Brocadiia bacterium]